MNAQQLFNKLSLFNVEYAVMRNFVNLPNVSDTDLDIYVKEADKNKFQAALFSLNNERIFHVINGTKSSNFESFMIFDAQSNEICGFRLDVNFGLYFRGQKILIDNIAEQIEERHHTFVFSKSLSLLATWMKCFVNHEPVKYDVLAETKATYSSYGSIFSDWMPSLSGTFSSKADFFKFVEQHIVLEDFPDFGGVSYQLTIAQRLSAISDKVKRYVKPGGLWITFIGVDGSGKSTIITKCREDLIGPTHGKISVSHFRPKLLPARSVQKTPTSTTEHVTGTRKITKPFFRQLKLMYLFADYFLGYFFKVRVELAKSGGVIIFDRYAVDLLYDAGRINISELGTIWKLLWRFLPKPDATFVVVADPQQIVSRKNERTRQEIEKLQKKLFDLEKLHRKMMIISNHSDLQTSYFLFSQKFLQFLSSKTIK